MLKWKYFVRWPFHTPSPRRWPHGNEASRFGQPPQPTSIHAGFGSWLSGVLASAGSPTALKRVRALLQQLDRARVHRPGSGGREFRPW
jgi:hypothetical protein